VLEKRTRLVASKVWEYLKATDPMAKTIVFCDDQDHAERMRQELVKLIPAAASNRRYVMRITGDDNEGKAQLSYFIDNDEPYPVIATTSKLLTTGVDAKTCKLIVLDQNINSMTEFKQIIGRGTRLREDYQKLYFTIMDFKGATRLFADPNFDGEPVVIYEPKPDEPVVPPEITNHRLASKNPNRRPYEGPDADPEATPEERRRRRRSHQIRHRRRQCARGRRAFAIPRCRRQAHHRGLPRSAQGRHQKSLQAEFGTSTDFLRRWNSCRTQAGRAGRVGRTRRAAGNPATSRGQWHELDVFDLVAHVAFDQKPLTRRERANNVKKRDLFGKYGEQARAVLEALLDKFADHGVQDIEDAKVLELPPFDQFGSKTQIRRGIFGSVEQYTQAVNELEQALYDAPEQKQA
jgi:type I restriction enzyme R subunit